MATVTLSTPVSSTCVTQTGEKKFLDYSIEELDPNQTASLERQSFLWKTAAVTTLVAYTTLAVGIFIGTGVFAPTYIPLAGICSLVFLNTVYSFVKTFQQNSVQAINRANQLKKIQHHYADLTHATVENLQGILLRKMGIIWFQIPGMLQHPENLKLLKPLIARHLFWEGYIQQIEETKRTILQKASRLIAQNNPENREEIYELRATSLELDDLILKSKVKDAFVLAAIQHPDLKGTVDNIGDFSPLSSQERILGREVEVNDPTLHHLFIFKNPNIVPLTIEEVKRNRIIDLSRRILAAASVAG